MAPVARHLRLVEVPGMQTRFNHTHGSGRFTVGAGLLGTWLDRQRVSSDLITYTEVDKNKRASELKAPGWEVVYGDKGPRDDCGIAWRSAVFTKVWAGTITLDAPSYRNKRGWMTDQAEAAYAVLELNTGKRVVVGVAHMPTSVGGTRIYSFAARSLRKNAQELSKKHRGDAIMLVADWNRNLRLAATRTYLRRYAPKYRVTWNSSLPKRGTFGHEIIDFTLAHGLKVIRRPHLLAHSAVSDHTGYRETLAL